MAFCITQSNIDTPAKVSVLDTVKSAASSMAGKLRDIVNTMIPGRTGRWTPPHTASSPSSTTGSFSSRGSFVGIRTVAATRRDSSSCFSRPGSPPPSPTESTSWLYSKGLRYMEKTMEGEAALSSMSLSDKTSDIDEMSGYESDDEFCGELRKPFSMEDVSTARGWGRSSSDPGPLDIDRPYIERSSSLRDTAPCPPVDTFWVFGQSDAHKVDSTFSYLRLDEDFRDDIESFTRQT